MFKETRDFTKLEAIDWMLENNSGLTLSYPVSSCTSSIISNRPIQELKFPDGWYYDEKTNVLTNKYNSSTRIFHNIQIKYQP